MVASRTRHLATLLATTAVALLMPAVANAAASLSLTVAPDPVETIATQFSVVGTAPGDQGVFATVKYKPTGGTACAPNPSADDGTYGFGTSFLPAGPYSASNNVTPKKAGTYLVCAWLVYDQVFAQTPSDLILAGPDVKTITVRPPKLSLTLAAPATVNPGQSFPVSATAQAEAKRSLSVYALVDTGRGCPANADAANQTDTASVLSGEPVVGGPTTLSQNISLKDPGAYVLCGYFWNENATDPPQAVASAAVTVLAPPPPCVVPAVVADEPLATARGRLTAASCTPGKVRYVASARYARGSVFKFAPVPGTSLANAAVVNLYVSSGAPCIVPALPRSRTLTQVKRRLVASGCAVGKVTHRRSRTVRRGRVVALTKARGKRLAPRTAVGIVVSRGRR